MYRINPETNRIAPLATKRFSDLGFSERNHLQEWLANEPEAFGEELLIIQKEFDGFDDTRERLDLLAIDKDGNLVIIENKLDDTGRDVVWQALKYASYCANLKKTQIINIYQRYLNQNDKKSISAAERIIEFLEADDIESLNLNKGNTQRLILVAAHYRKEVTNTVLWLNSFNIACQCFKVTPYASGEEIFLNIEQIIPTPESQDFMIGMAMKDAEEKSANNEEKQRHKIRYKYWEQALEKFRNSPCQLFNNISPAKDHWLYAGSGISQLPYELIFAKKEIRVGLELARPVAEENTKIFEFLYSKKQQIENDFGAELEWLPLPVKKACRIQFTKSVDGYNEEFWPEMVDWMIKNMTQFEKVIKPHMQEISQLLKNN